MVADTLELLRTGPRGMKSDVDGLWSMAMMMEAEAVERAERSALGVIGRQRDYLSIEVAGWPR